MKLKSSIKSFFQLVRIPTIFSAFSNAYAGYWMGREMGSPNALMMGVGATPKPLFLGMAAAGLYLMAGMALNDIADCKVDKLERVNRPLPSGAITLTAAWIISITMLALALFCQWLANPSNPLAAWVGVIL